jgi:hypothetical protein
LTIKRLTRKLMWLTSYIPCSCKGSMNLMLIHQMQNRYSQFDTSVSFGLVSNFHRSQLTTAAKFIFWSSHDQPDAGDTKPCHKHISKRRNGQKSTVLRNWSWLNSKSYNKVSQTNNRIGTPNMILVWHRTRSNDNKVPSCTRRNK